MSRYALALVVLAIWAIVPLACKAPREQISPDMRKEVEALQGQKDLIEEKLADIERRRSLLAERNEKELEEIRRRIEIIQGALRDMQAQLDAMYTVPATAPAPPKRLPIEVSVVLLIIIVFCVLIALKLRSTRLRERAQPPPEEAARDSGAESPKS